MIYLKLCWAFLKIGLFGFGGGYAIISLIQHEIAPLGISSQEFTDIIAVSQMTPGPIGINSATYVGYTACQAAGYSMPMAVLGSIVATVSIILPSFIIMLILCKLYLRLKDNQTIGYAFDGLRPTVVGLIGAAALLLMNSENFGALWTYDWWWAMLIFGTTVAASLKKVHPILLIILAAIAGMLIY